MAWHWITGKTYIHKDHIKELGGKWDTDKKKWKIKLEGKQDSKYSDLVTLGLKLTQREVQDE